MSTWFECKVKYQKTDQNGNNKAVSELYLVDAMSFTEAEARITKEMEAYISGEFNVVNLKIANFSELLPSQDGDRWYKCKVLIVSIDETKGKEKKISTQMLVDALNIKDAYEKIDIYMEDSISEYEIASITQSTILDVFPIHEVLDEAEKEAEPEKQEALTEI